MFTPLILTEDLREELDSGNSQAVGEVGNWVRGHRPRRRQLALYHLCRLAPEFSLLPWLPLQSVEVTVGEGPLSSLVSAPTSQVCPKNLKKSKNIKIILYLRTMKLGDVNAAFFLKL